MATEPQILWEKRASQLLKYRSSQNTIIVRHFVLFSDYVITIYVITPRAIIATPSVRRIVRRTRPPDGPALRPTFTVRRTYVEHIPRTYSGQTPDTSMDTGQADTTPDRSADGTVVWTPHRVTNNNCTPRTRKNDYTSRLSQIYSKSDRLIQCYWSACVLLCLCPPACLNAVYRLVSVSCVECVECCVCISRLTCYIYLVLTIC